MTDAPHLASGVENGPGGAVEWEEWDGFSSLDGHPANPGAMILEPPLHATESQSGRTSTPTKASRILGLRDGQDAPPGMNGFGFGFQRKLLSVLKNIKKCCFTYNAPRTFSTHPKPPRRVLPKFALLMQETYECTACLTNIDVSEGPAMQVQCGHLYHGECLLQLVQVSMRSPTNFPPRCCRKDISPLSFEHLLSPEQKEEYALRELEQSTPRRVYCANPRCSRFLGARDKRTPVLVYPCPSAACATLTCARCRAAVDPSPGAPVHACGHEPAHRAALRLGHTLGWARCPECEQLIERDGGCSHMTCACGAHFCYGCGGKWQTCSCVEWRAIELPPGRGPRAPQNAGAGRRVRERDLFAPLQDAGDLRGRLTLWAPPTLATPPRAPEDSRPSQPAPAPPRERPPEDTTALRSRTVPSEVPREVHHPLARQISPGKTESVQMSIFSVQEDPTEGYVGSCLPFKPDTQILARGEKARVNRERSGARRAATM